MPHHQKESKVILLTKTLDETSSDTVKNTLLIDRETLYKRRWRTVHQGQEIAISLNAPVKHGTLLSSADQKHCYYIKQHPEEVLVIPLPHDSSMAAKIGWYLGNRHIPIEVREDSMLMENFPTLTDSLNRIGITYHLTQDVLQCAPHSADHRH